MAEKVLIKLLERRQDKLHIDGEFLYLVQDETEEREAGLSAVLNGQQINCFFTKRCCAQKFEKETGAAKKHVPFFVELSFEQLKKKNKLQFFCQEEEGKKLVSVESDGYQSHVSSMVRRSYWCFDRYMVRFMPETIETGNPLLWHALGESSPRAGLIIDRAGKPKRILQELKLLAGMPFGKNHSRKMFVDRLNYWRAYPKWKDKQIWITFDKLYKGGDCGEYLHRYLVKHASPEISPVYIINKNSPDAKRLKEEGVPVQYYHTKEQKLSYLFAKLVFATHSSVHAFCGYNAWEVQFLQDRLCAVNTCIQHGLSVQDLSADSNRVVNNNKRYYCASRYEVENLSQDSYDYAPGVLRLTGIPRYDGLMSETKRQILITPTWRSYLAMPSVLGKARPYNPEFKNSEYFKIYTELICSRQMIQTAKEEGYQIIYLLHPVVSAQLSDFDEILNQSPFDDTAEKVGDYVQVKSALDINYEEILRQSDLMITDYSGVQFDFAYMKKPVLYYHPAELPPHYEEGTFCYETQSFGEIYETQEELIRELCSYMKNDCKMKPQYEERVEDFFAFTDLENCRRIYEDALELMNL